MFLLFDYNQKTLAVSLYDVKNIVLTVDIYPLPFIGNILLGLVNIKGELLPVFNLNTIFKDNFISASKKLISFQNGYNFLLPSDGKIFIEKELGEKIETNLENEFVKANYKHNRKIINLLNLDKIKAQINNTLLKEAK